MEGMILDKKDTDDILSYKDRENIVMYAGTLDKKYGIDTLVQAFERINNPKYNLYIYGDGDYKEELVKKAKMNSNIKYRRNCSK